MNIPTHTELVRQIEDFLERHDMKPSRLAREATGEPGLIDAILSANRSPTLTTVQKLSDYMRGKDAELNLRAKLDAPPPGPVEEQEADLPFVQAPGTPPGACSPTSS